jgi:hypothetical protein
MSAGLYSTLKTYYFYKILPLSLILTINSYGAKRILIVWSTQIPNRYYRIYFSILRYLSVIKSLPANSIEAKPSYYRLHDELISRTVFCSSSSSNIFINFSIIPMTTKKARQSMAKMKIVTPASTSLIIAFLSISLQITYIVFVNNFFS